MPYPASLEIDYPDRSLNRLTTFFRVFTVIPIAIVLGSLSHSEYVVNSGGHTTTYASGAAAMLFVPVLLMLLFRRKYPGWWFDWNLELTRFSTRVGAYVALMDDVYPSTDEEQSVHLQIERPDGEQLNRWLPLVKWLLAIPALHHPCVPRHRGVLRGGVRMVCDPLHRPLPPRRFRIRDGCDALDAARDVLRHPADDGSIPAVQHGLRPAES